MKRYLKVALRQLAREKLYALLNVSGLALGLACCLMLGLYLWSELTYDRHHVNHERIYRIATQIKFGDGRTSDLAITSGPFGPMMAAEYPEYFKSSVRFRAASRPNPELLRYEDQSAYWKDVYLVDSNVFEVFTHEIVYGDPRTALTQPDSIAISRRMAHRYFGNENPIGRTLTTDGGKSLAVRLVFEDLPENSHLRYDALLSNKGAGADVPTDFTERLQRLLNFGDFEYTYVVLADGADPREYARLSEAFNEKYTKFALTMAKLEMRSWLEPLADIHLGADLEYDQPHGNRMYLYAFAAVAILILGLACINYVNLATARAAQRTRAIGLRKILGAGRGSLIAQSLGESVLFALLATVLGVILVEVLLSLPAVSALFGKTLTLDLFGRPLLALGVVAFGVLRGPARGDLSGGVPVVLHAAHRARRPLSTRRIAASRSARVHSVRDLDRRDRLHAAHGPADALHRQQGTRLRQGEPRAGHAARPQSRRTRIADRERAREAIGRSWASRRAPRSWAATCRTSPAKPRTTKVS